MLRRSEVFEALQSESEAVLRVRGEAQAVFGREEEEDMVLRNMVRTLAFTGVCALAAGVSAQSFEPPVWSGSAAGIALNGQGAFFNPVAGSVSGQVYTYAGNAVGLPANPTGGQQFVGSTGPGGGVFSRSQTPASYGAGTGTWTVAFDIAATFNGQLPSAQNIGSLSTQDFPGDRTYIALARWVDPVTASEWNADYVWFDAAGAQLIESVGDPGFQNLAVNHWYRWSTTFDLDTNQILRVSLTDITGGGTATNNPVDRYLVGGAGGGGLLPPSGYRFFGGASGVAGNTLGWDNVTIIPAPGSLLLLGLGALALRRRR